MYNHGFVSKVDNWFRDSEGERSQPSSIASYEDERLHTALTDCTRVVLPWKFVLDCDASIVGRCTGSSQNRCLTAAYKRHHIVAEGTARCAAAHSVAQTRKHQAKSCML